MSIAKRSLLSSLVRRKRRGLPFCRALGSMTGGVTLCSTGYARCTPPDAELPMDLAVQEDVKVKAIRLADALAGIRAQLWPILDTEAIGLSGARGRVLAADLIAKVSLPHWDSAAMDGFAVRASDLVPGRISRLTVVGEAAAGHPFNGTLGDGQAVRILTGAPLPREADIIIMQEVCQVDGGELLVEGNPTSKKHWRPRGEDVGLGSRAISAGTRLRAQDVALASALGCKQLQVRRQPRVGLFST